jgi:hypothetical protein
VCRACVMAQTGMPDGKCAPLPAGAKDTRCTVEPCGRDGFCAAGGVCRRVADGTVCATECCPGNVGPGPNLPARVCQYRCNNGQCARNNPVTLDSCGGAQCCCPSVGTPGAPACVASPLLCGGQCVN